MGRCPQMRDFQGDVPFEVPNPLGWIPMGLQSSIKMKSFSSRVLKNLAKLRPGKQNWVLERPPGM